MTSIRVAGAQLPVSGDIAANVIAIEKAIAFAADESADILLTPEFSLSGVAREFDVAQAAAALERITASAREAHVGLALGTSYVESDGLCYNQVRFYTPCGEYLGFHAKQLLCGSMSGPAEGEVTYFTDAPLRTFDFGGITIGGLVCNDMWANPQCTPMPDTHLTQRLAEMGVQIIFHAVNGGRGDNDWSHNVVRPFHRSNLQMRAVAGNLWIITVDNGAPEHIAASSPSGVVSPDGAWVCQTPDRGMQMFAWTIELP